MSRSTTGRAKPARCSSAPDVAQVGGRDAPAGWRRRGSRFRRRKAPRAARPASARRSWRQGTGRPASAPGGSGSARRAGRSSIAARARKRRGRSTLGRKRQRLLVGHDSGLGPRGRRHRTCSMRKTLPTLPLCAKRPREPFGLAAECATPVSKSRSTLARRSARSPTTRFMQEIRAGLAACVGAGETAAKQALVGDDGDHPARSWDPPRRAKSA